MGNEILNKGKGTWDIVWDMWNLRRLWETEFRIKRGLNHCSSYEEIKTTNLNEITQGLSTKWKKNTEPRLNKDKLIKQNKYKYGTGREITKPQASSQLNLSSLQMILSPIQTVM